jgi:hypothetical protein
MHEHSFPTRRSSDLSIEDSKGKPVFFSGNHLITEIMWNLTPKECNLNIRCMKDSVNADIETTKIEYGDTEK